MMPNTYCGFTSDVDMIAAYDEYVTDGGTLSVFEWMYYELPRVWERNQQIKALNLGNCDVLIDEPIRVRPVAKKRIKLVLRKRDSK